MRVAALAGGVGGAKLVDGLAQVLPSENLTVIVNTGDDFTHMGLRVCPDLDTVCYTLAGIANPETGWGRADESWNALEALTRLGGPDWFRLGDRDLGLHLERTRRLESGERLSQVTRDFCSVWGIKPIVLPMSDDRVETWVDTELGELAFQEYFVHHACRPAVKGFRFIGSHEARPAPGVLEALEAADAVIFCPSNPWVSIDPILSVPGVGDIIRRKVVVAISPIIGGKTIKGPAAKMFTELGIQPSCIAVYQHYQELLSGFMIDEIDRKLAHLMQGTGVKIKITNTIMRDERERCELADRAMELIREVTA